MILISEYYAKEHNLKKWTLSSNMKCRCGIGIESLLKFYTKFLNKNRLKYSGGYWKFDLWGKYKLLTFYISGKNLRHSLISLF